MPEHPPRGNAIVGGGLAPELQERYWKAIEDTQREYACRGEAVYGQVLEAARQELEEREAARQEAEAEREKWLEATTHQADTRRRRPDPTRIDVAQPIDVAVWKLCARFDEGTSLHNCAYSVLTTDDIPLPDHVCDGVQVASRRRYSKRHGREHWKQVRNRYGDVFLVVEREVPGGRAALFGRKEWRQDSDDDFDPEGWTSETGDCAIEFEGTGKDLDRALRSWHDRVFRDHHAGLPGQSRIDDAWLQHRFEEKKQEHPRTKWTVQIMADFMGMHKSTLERAMQRGVIPRRKDW
jgi:hypothetical protein